jgi:Tfp pilus assembly protein PilX
VIELVALGLVALIAVVAIVAILTQADRHSNQTSRLLAHMAAQHATWARERWELNTRISAQNAGAHAPIAAPATPNPQEVLQTLGLLQPSVPDPDDVDDEDVDDSHLVGTGPAMPGPSEVA